MRRAIHSTEQIIALHGLFSEVAAVSETALAEVSGRECEVEVVEAHACTLEEQGERGLRVGDDLVAGVIARVEGGLCGSALLALEPDEALAWVRACGATDPLDTFVSLGGCVLDAVAQALRAATRTKTAVCPARLVEESEPVLLAATHAPADTLVVSARLRIVVRGEAFSAAIHLLVDPKYFTKLLSSLCAAIH